MVVCVLVRRGMVIKMILRLVKLNFSALFAGIFRGYRKKKKTKPITVILVGLLIIYIVGALGVMFGTMFYMICAPMFQMGIGWLYFAMAGLLVFALCFVGSIFMVQSQIFSEKDNELLLSMPIKPPAILAGRLVALVIIEYLYAALIIIPVFVVLIITGYISSVPALGIVFYFAAALLTPLVALAAGCLVGWVVAMISSKMHNRNLPTLILSLVFLAVYFWFCTQMMNNVNTLIANGAEIAEALRRSVFPAYHLGTAIADGNALSFLIFAACAIVPFVLLCYLLSISFVKLATANRVARKVKYREKALRASGARFALLKRELMHLWALPMYILNSMLGAVATVVLAIVLIARPGVLLDPLRQFTALFPGFDMGIAGAIIISALAAINTVSAPSVSLEGKSLWIVKSLPVRARDVLLAKVGMHIAACGAPALLAGIACIAALPMNGIAQPALTFVLPLSITVMFSLLGVTLNLTFPRLDWINPIQPVKQGASCMLTMFGGMALVAVLLIIYIFLPGGAITPENYLLICAAVFIAASVVLYAYLIGAGSRKFEAL